MTAATNVYDVRHLVATRPPAPLFLSLAHSELAFLRRTAVVVPYGCPLL